MGILWNYSQQVASIGRLCGFLAFFARAQFEWQRKQGIRPLIWLSKSLLSLYEIHQAVGFFFRIDGGEDIIEGDRSQRMSDLLI